MVAMGILILEQILDEMDGFSFSLFSIMLSVNFLHLAFCILRYFLSTHNLLSYFFNHERVLILTIDSLYLLEMVI